jgi:hypothetical protein
MKKALLSVVQYLGGGGDVSRCCKSDVGERSHTDYTNFRKAGFAAARLVQVWAEGLYLAC